MKTTLKDCWIWLPAAGPRRPLTLHSSIPLRGPEWRGSSRNSTRTGPGSVQEVAGLPGLPWLYASELETLLAAERAEFAHIVQQA